MCVCVCVWFHHHTSCNFVIALSLSSIPSLKRDSFPITSAIFLLSAFWTSFCPSAAFVSKPLLWIISRSLLICSSFAIIACCWVSSRELKSSSDFWSKNISLSCRSLSNLKVSSSFSCWPSKEIPDNEDEGDTLPTDRRSLTSLCCLSCSCKSWMISVRCCKDRWEKTKQKNNNNNGIGEYFFITLLTD